MAYSAGEITTTDDPQALVDHGVSDYIGLKNVGANEALFRMDGGPWITLAAGDPWHRSVQVTATVEVKSKTAGQATTLYYYLD